MKFSIAAATLLGSTALAAPASLLQRDVKYAIKDFTIHKYDGTIQQVSFSVEATNGGTLDLPCSLPDTAQNGNFQPESVYACGMSFTFQFIPASGTQTNELKLTQTEQGSGSVLFDDPPCTDGNQGPGDVVCTLSADLSVTLA